MNVSAIIVTRGDVPLDPIFESLPDEWEVVVWTNGEGVRRKTPKDWRSVREENGQRTEYFLPHGGIYTEEFTDDLSVYGRYAAIRIATGDLIYVQDDDVVLSNPKLLLREYIIRVNDSRFGVPPYFVVCNMPPEFRHEFYADHALVGFGAVFHRNAPKLAFDRFSDHVFTEEEIERMQGTWFQRTCDVVFTTLTPRVLVDVPKWNLPWAEDESRMYRQREHVGERTMMLELALEVRDGH